MDASQASNIQSILAALAAQQPAAPSQPGVPGQQQQQQQYAPPGAPAYGGALPVPASSGSVDLSAVRPVNSGTMSFDDVLSKARASAAAKGATSYDRPLVYGSDSRGGGDRDRDYGNTRSRSPPRGGDYRDDRRGGGGRGGGRDYGRDRSHSPPARSRNSPRGGRDRSPLRGSGGGGGDDNSETIDVESSLVGLIIGRQGENLRRIEGESNCRVQFLPPTDGSSFRQCRITGPRANRADVRAAINRIIEDSGMGPMNRGADKGGNAGGRGGQEVTPQEGEDFLQIMVPDRTVGLIIGRGGETIRDLQERSGCHINIVGESKSMNGLRPVNLIGTPEAAAKAKDFIMEVVDSDSRGEGPAAKRQQAQQQSGYGGGGGRNDGYGGGAGGPDKINDSVFVPSDAVGMIIGKGGETIREMQSTTGCKINVAQSSGPGETQREISLIGNADSIARAKQAIDEKVEAVRQKSAGGGYERRGGGGGGGRGYHDNNDRGNYSQQGSHSVSGASQQQQQQPGSGDAADPYAQYGGYQNYVALWYQSLMHQQQQQGGEGGEGGGAPAPAGGPPAS
ncbi:hypothetical protein VHEMI08030 [[Torrubiella] hemipterigena]|uniref:K Homology domain-containing protein n=1 Tax=[Torrubiella] hemipterigena TaxID=1531966 RepID=A0A0A1TMF8_9HYPO|nr:hypothetical protein VHEMI08030 [[Torrubiella] hemipterigena]